MSFAAIAAGADGLMIEVHPDPAHAVVGWSAIVHAGELRSMMATLRLFAEVSGRGL